jgi:hypothetical protein
MLEAAHIDLLGGHLGQQDRQHLLELEIAVAACRVSNFSALLDPGVATLEVVAAGDLAVGPFNSVAQMQP